MAMFVERRDAVTKLDRSRSADGGREGVSLPGKDTGYGGIPVEEGAIQVEQDGVDHEPVTPLRLPPHVGQAYGQAPVIY
jgi:hypothetical protein